MKSLTGAILLAMVLLCRGRCTESKSASSDPTAAPGTGAAECLASTQPLTEKTDIASNLVAGVDRFLLRELDSSEERRARYWHRDYSSAEAYSASVRTNRERLAYILGVRDARARFQSPELVATLNEPAVLCRTKDYDVLGIRWPVLQGIHGEGLLLQPHSGKGKA